jgi:O-antigen/teichoic acid export membrane protein
MPLRTSAIYIISKLIPGGLGFALTIFLSWLLNPEQYGTYGYGMAIAMMISTVGFEWLGQSFMRFYQGEGDTRTFLPTITIIFIGLCILTIIVLSSFVILSPTNESIVLMMVCTIGAWCYAYFELAGRVAIARFQSGHYFWMNLIRNTLILLICVGVANVYRSPLAVLGAGFATMLVAALPFWRAPIRPSAFDMKLMWRILVYGGPLFVIMTLSALLTNFSRILLKNIAGPVELGYYTAAAMLAVNTLNTIGSGIGSATYSMAVRTLERGQREDLLHQLERNLTLLVALLLPSAVGILILAHPIAELCFPPAYVDHVAILLPWLAFGTSFCAIEANYFDQGFQLGHCTGLLVVVLTISATISIVLSVLLIPHLGGLGSAIALATSSLISMILASFLVQRAHPMPIPLGGVLRVCAATAIMAACLWPLRSQPVGHLGLVVMAGILVFVAGSLMFNVLGCRNMVFDRLAAWRGNRSDTAPRS